MEGNLKVTKNISALTARTQLGQILERVKKNQDRFLKINPGGRRSKLSKFLLEKFTML